MAGRAALVTGGGGGIGEATGRLFAEEGAAVALVDTDHVAVEAAAASIARDVKGARVIALVADLTREAECARVVGETLAELHGLHTLVNVAGVRLYTALAEADSEGWEFILRVNAVCPGGTITPYHIRRAAAQGVSEAEMRTQRTHDNLLGRWAEPREVAYPILFLASDESSYVTGATLMVDAGKSIM